MSIFNRIKQAKHEARQSTLAEYFAFIGKLDADNATDEDMEQLSRFLDALGRSPEQAEKDRTDVLYVQQAVRVLTDNADASKLAEKANDAYLKVCADRQELHQEITAKVSAAYLEAETQRGRADHYQSKKRELLELRNANPILFGAIVDAKAEKRLSI